MKLLIEPTYRLTQAFSRMLAPPQFACSTRAQISRHRKLRSFNPLVATSKKVRGRLRHNLHVLSHDEPLGEATPQPTHKLESNRRHFFPLKIPYHNAVVYIERLYYIWQ